MHELIRKEVEVITPEITYKGILMEVTEAGISLQSVNGWISIPMERILEIRKVD